MPHTPLPRPSLPAASISLALIPLVRYAPLVVEDREQRLQGPKYSMWWSHKYNRWYFFFVHQNVSSWEMPVDFVFDPNAPGLNWATQHSLEWLFDKMHCTTHAGLLAPWISAMVSGYMATQIFLPAGLDSLFSTGNLSLGMVKCVEALLFAIGSPFIDNSMSQLDVVNRATAFSILCTGISYAVAGDPASAWMRRVFQVTAACSLPIALTADRLYHRLHRDHSNEGNIGNSHNVRVEVGSATELFAGAA